MADDRDHKIEAIVQTARASRPKRSRSFWAALVMGAICIAGFVAILAVDSGESSSAPIRPREGGRGFGTGLAIGVGVGVAIGYAMARRKPT